MGKNVAVFVDVANIFYAAKAAGVDIDYVTLLKAATAGRDFVRAYAYTGLDPDNENQRNFHSFLSRHGYKVVSKDIRKYGDGKVKANLDIELVVDMMKTARNLDVAIVVSGDGDFAPAIRAVQEMGVRVEVISFRGNTSSDLIEVADIFTDITQLAKVERGSSRSGRRVAEEEFDMTGTEIPDKQTEGSGQRERRSRGRTRRGAEEFVSRPREAAVGRDAGREAEIRDRAREVDVRDRGREGVAAGAGAPLGGSLTVLPGEKLSRAARAVPADDDVAADVEFDELVDEDELAAPAAPAEEALEGEAGEPRRRRRRGGRGRGRGRGRPEDGLEPGTEPAAAARVDRVERPERPERRERPIVEFEDDDVQLTPRGPRPTPFGSIWDSQLGVPTAPTSALGPLLDEDEDEPEIPEYLLAERRRGPQGPGQGRSQGQGQGRGGRGARAGYSAAIDRERYGRGGLNRYGEPQRPQPQGGGRLPQPQPRREDRPDRPPQGPARGDRPGRSEEWSEVPPEIEQMLRAQMAARGSRPAEGVDRARRPGSGGDVRPDERAAARFSGEPASQAAASAEAGTAEQSAAAASTVAEAAPARRRGRPPKAASAVTTLGEPGATVGSQASPADTVGGEAPTAGRRGRPRRAVVQPEFGAGESSPAATVALTEGSTPARRGRPRLAAASTAALGSADAAPAAGSDAVAAKPRRGRPPKAAGQTTPAASDAAGAEPASGGGATVQASPARRGRPARSAPSPAASDSSADAGGVAPAPPVRRRTRSTSAG